MALIIPDWPIIGLELAAVFALFGVSINTLWIDRRETPPEDRENQIRKEMQTWIRELSQQAIPISKKPEPKKKEKSLSLGFDRKYAQLTQKVIQGVDRLEGGFYHLDLDEFFGYANSQGPTSELRRHDPPPLESPFIRSQVRLSLENVTNEPVLQLLDVESSRVIIATAPVFKKAPTRIGCWLMVRVRGPKDLHEESQKNRFSSYLALGGLVIGLVLSGHLTWKLRRTRAREQKLQKELQRSERLASLGRMLAGFAHEIRNPLAGIRSTVQLWQRLDHEDWSPQSLQAVIHGVDQVDQLISRLLVFARSGQESTQQIDLNTLTQDILELLHAQAELQGIHIIFKPGVPISAFEGCPSSIQQVIMNLAMNSIQAMPEGGELTCQTHFSSHAIEFMISDSGPGVALEHRSKLFEPFFTTRSEGTGLGLALCREIVLQHGGEIEYVPKDTGACFRVCWHQAVPVQGVSGLRNVHES